MSKLWLHRLKLFFKWYFLKAFYIDIMSSKIRNTIIACGGTLLVVLSFVGTIGASLSWFTYSKKVGITYSGTSISSNKLLQIGIVTDLDLTSENFTMDGGVAWTLPGSGISADQLNAYLSSSGYASTSLSPITSRKYTTEDTLKLTKSPYDYSPDNKDIALKETYVQVPFAFRIINVSDGDYVARRNVWVTQAVATGQENEGFNVADGIRVHFGSTKTKFILNPNASISGYTKVAGLLDLNNDGYYDSWDEHKEIIYGDYSGNPTYSDVLEETSELDDSIYNTGKDKAYNFLAAHKKGNKIVTNWDELTINKQEYFSINDIAPGVNELGLFKDGKPICNTGDSKVGYCTMTVWAEGWDLSIVDEISKLSFNLGITFEIDKV